MQKVLFAYYLQLRKCCGPRVSSLEALKASLVTVSSPWVQPLQIYFESVQQCSTFFTGVLKLAFNFSWWVVSCLRPYWRRGLLCRLNIWPRKTVKNPQDLRTRCPSINQKRWWWKLSGMVLDRGPSNRFKTPPGWFFLFFSDLYNNYVTYTILFTIYTICSLLYKSFRWHVVWTGGRQRLLSVLSCVVQHAEVLFRQQWLWKKHL